MYFEGDMIWYRGRIINYDEQSDKHFVHFKSDNTGEWISLQVRQSQSMQTAATITNLSSVHALTSRRRWFSWALRSAR